MITKFYVGIVKQFQSFLLQSTILLLLGFTSVAGDSFFLLTTDGTELIEVISESSAEGIDELAACDDLDGSDDDSSTDNVFTQPSQVVCYPLVIKAGQLNNRPSLTSVPFYILYQRLILYHTVA